MRVANPAPLKLSAFCCNNSTSLAPSSFSLIKCALLMINTSGRPRVLAMRRNANSSSLAKARSMSSNAVVSRGPRMLKSSPM